jgi:hypothetical protein
MVRIGMSASSQEVGDGVANTRTGDAADDTPYQATDDAPTAAPTKFPTIGIGDPSTAPSAAPA